MNYFRGIEVKEIIKKALNEDIGKGDITTRAIVPQDKHVKAMLIANESCVLCGLGIAGEVFKAQDKNIRFKTLAREGERIKKGKIIARISGKAQNILTAERVALNFLSLLSGIATKARAYVDKVKPYKVNPVRNKKGLIGKISNGVKIMDTRKTIPGLRALEKYAVRTGGGYNHRMGLDEMVLIKDNHLKVMSDKLWVMGLKKMRDKISPKIKIEVEVKTLKEFQEALKLNPDIIMLDNMKVKDIKEAVALRKGTKPEIEASGNVNLKNIREIARTGVEMVSIGALTHSVQAIDISLEIL